MPHDPATHVGEPLVELHTLPQAPQLPVDVLVWTSQPVEARPSQLP